MELPPALRQAVDAALEGISARDLSAASEALSRRYRGEVRDGRFHVADDLTARAYLAARLPATYAAVRAALAAIADMRRNSRRAACSISAPGLAPHSGPPAIAGRISTRPR